MDRHSISEAVVESEFTTDRSREICVSALGAKKISWICGKLRLGV